MNYTSLILFAIFFTVIGFILALLINRLREPDQSSLARIRKEREATDWQTPVTRLRPGSLQVWKDTESGKMVIEIDGKVYHSISQLNLEQRKALGATTGELVNWLNQAPAASPAPAIQPEPPRIRPQPVVPPPVTPEPASDSLRSRSLLSRALQPNLTKEPARPTTLAAQVNDILQTRLAGSPLAGRNIRLIDLPNHGLAVEVGQNRYESIDEVPDPDVRQLLKEAVAEWQQRARSGL